MPGDESAIATFQTISAMVVATAAPVSPSMLIKIYPRGDID